jgi:hypothetical protein
VNEIVFPAGHLPAIVAEPPDACILFQMDRSCLQGSEYPEYMGRSAKE